MNVRTGMRRTVEPGRHATPLLLSVLLLLPTTAASASTPHTVTVAEASNAKLVRVHVGDRVRVTLASTYWDFAPVSGKAVRAVGQPEVLVGGAGCPKIMGTGCGSATITVKAVARGRATVKASRTTCGEALQCGVDQRAYQVGIVVS